MKQSDQKTDEEEFEEIEQRIDHARKTFKLNLRAIRNLDKATSRKFVLPLTETKEGVEKWNQLIIKPFGFLAYNGSKFSVDLTLVRQQDDDTFFVDDNEQSIFREKFEQYEGIKNRTEAKRKYYIEKEKKLTKASEKLEQQVVALKEQFEEKTTKVTQPKLLRFFAERTKTNIVTIRKAEGMVNARINALKNKRLTNKPKKFFKRAVRLFLGKTGDDVLNDLSALGLTSKEDYLLSIDYLYFLMTVLEERKDQFVPPVITIVDIDDLDVGFKKSKLLKILTGHMFIHTITVTKKEDEKNLFGFKVNEEIPYDTDRPI